MTDIIGGSQLVPGIYFTTEADVRAILGLQASTSVAIFLASAHGIMLKVELCAGAELSNLELGIIEAWLAAHFYTTMNPSIASKSIAGGSVSYQRGQFGTRLETTPYGQQALLLDTSGCLAEITGEKMGLTWLGLD